MELKTWQIKVRFTVYALAIGLVAIAALTLIEAAKSKDTPIVIVGGSIHAEAAFWDMHGWQRRVQYSSYSARPNAPFSPDSGNIDVIVLQNFDPGPNPTTLTGTGGWAIRVWDKNRSGGGNITPSHSVRACSDRLCSASKKNLQEQENPAICKTPFASNGPAYFTVGSSARWQEKKFIWEISKLYFHDRDCDGDSSNSEDKTCDTIYQVDVEKCLPQPAMISYACKVANGKCTVSIGQ